MFRFKSQLSAALLVLIAISSLVGLSLLARNLRSSKAQNIVPLDSLIAHEWGTFTSIAGKDGIALEWRPLNGPSDLPKFVHTIQDQTRGLRHGPKYDLKGAVRMETPVIYFYSPYEMEVSVNVDFPAGKITEWYPQARSVNTGINWGRLKVVPGSSLTLPVDSSISPYYAARETDSTPVQVCSNYGKPTQQEKFLFYRGVGTFGLPLSVKLEGGNIALKNIGDDEISHLLIFENRAGRIGYQFVDRLANEMTVGRPTPGGKLKSMIQELTEALVGSGLYEKEAAAMIKTWRSSWFEEGLRVFYILPRRTTDQVLPLTIEPKPAELVRVLVGRAEVITPEMEESVRKRVAMLRDPSSEKREAAAQAIRAQGRFFEPILESLLKSETDSVVRDRIKNLIALGPK